MSVETSLGAIRRRRGISAAELAKAAGVSRQTIHAIEAGEYLPNTEVSLRMARALAVTIEDLFQLRDESTGDAAELSTLVLSGNPISPGQAVRICRVGDQRVSIPVTASPYFLPEADGIVARAPSGGNVARVISLGPEDTSAKRLVVAGCDPAIGLLVRMAEQRGGTELIPASASSTLALSWLTQGQVHVAGMHLLDPETGEFNLPYLRRHFPEEDFAVVSFAGWEEGFVVRKGNPRQIRKVEDLARKRVRYVNRETGSGSRALLDRLLAEAGIPTDRITGYRHEAHGHLAAAYGVAAQEADACIATSSAARAFDLDFIPLQKERYDFVIRRESLRLPAMERLLELMQTALLRTKLEALAGYDVTRLGSVLA